MSEQPETEPLKNTSEPTTGTNPPDSAAEADDESGLTPARAKMQAIMEGAAAQQSGPYQMMPQFNIGVQPGTPAALLGLPISTM